MRPIEDSIKDYVKQLKYIPYQVSLFFEYIQTAAYDEKKKSLLPSKSDVNNQSSNIRLALEYMLSACEMANKEHYDLESNIYKKKRNKLTLTVQERLKILRNTSSFPVSPKLAVTQSLSQKMNLENQEDGVIDDSNFYQLYQRLSDYMHVQETESNSDLINALQTAIEGVWKIAQMLSKFLSIHVIKISDCDILVSTNFHGIYCYQVNLSDFEYKANGDNLYSWHVYMDDSNLIYKEKVDYDKYAGYDNLRRLEEGVIFGRLIYDIGQGSYKEHQVDLFKKGLRFQIRGCCATKRELRQKHLKSAKQNYEKLLKQCPECYSALNNLSCVKLNISRRYHSDYMCDLENAMRHGNFSPIPFFNKGFVAFIDFITSSSFSSEKEKMDAALIVCDNFKRVSELSHNSRIPATLLSLQIINANPYLHSAYRKKYGDSF